MSKLRIAMIAPPWLRVPPTGYGGIELVVSGLTKELIRQGVAVELFSVGQSVLPGANTHALFEREQWRYHGRPYYESMPLAAAHILHAINSVVADGRFDLIHDHNVYSGPPILDWATQSKATPPALHTLHGPPFTTKKPPEVDVDNRPFWRQLGRSPRLYYASISEALSNAAPAELKSRLLPVVHHGVELEDFPYESHKQGYFITLARFTPDKGQHLAARLCDELGYRLKMAGTVAGIATNKQLILELANPASQYRSMADFRYYSDTILPVTIRNPRIQFLGNISGQRKQKLVSHAKALLFPVDWEEPFGIAVIEALACGTPVVAMNRGAMPEIIDHGVTGFLAETEDEFRHYMQLCNEIDPAACRRSVERRFSTKIMAQGYIERYKTILRAA